MFSAFTQNWLLEIRLSDDDQIVIDIGDLNEQRHNGGEEPSALT